MSIGFPKPIKGTALLASRDRRATRKAHEDREMQAAKKRDGHVCRFPRCEFKSKDLPIDPAHAFKHRGIGGNPKGDLTSRELIVSLCRAHHGLLDAHEIEIDAMTTRMADGPLMFSARHRETGRMQCIAVEKSIGVSEARAL